MKGQVRVSTDRHFELLQSHPILAGIGEGQLQALAERGYLGSARRQHVLYLTGDVASQVFLVHEGRVNELHVDGGGGAVGLAHHHRGDLLGEECCWAPRTRDTMALAATPVVYSELPRDDFRRLLDAHVGLERTLYARLIERQACSAGRLCSALTKSARSKVAAVLLEFAAHGIATEEGCRLPWRLPQQEIAAFAGMTRETAALELRQLEAKGLVRREGRFLVLVSPERLAVIARSVRVQPDSRVRPSEEHSSYFA
ncbi:Crp/Fnr family transcriptional regulator [Nannocystis punicea]|uniref:Crp/Fnr family transcriptional regulator n=1 Tax=Nannocystis punicea TaxID=2995304 RepID=A0ABY7GXY7_9BACT|nr:Crp/Fnr family transcriptional regulator [Nannocystis poenicansa]WAS91841.1 Crp/Fnr family transcriptional regulator [Nannocystis poenicansa]